MTVRAYCVEPHTYGPGDPLTWPEWAAEMSRTREQHQCPDCGLWAIWRPTTTTPPADLDAPGLFDINPGTEPPTP